MARPHAPEPQPPARWQQWMQAAQNGSGDALGELLQACRHYLLLVAEQNLDSDLRDKVAASDLVQDTCLEALRDFGRQFRGDTEEELLAWLKRILLNNLANQVRRYRGTEMRDVRR